ncbi:RBBP9/YdeN family alpha/beta hydrolase [Sinorhizobium mexicanum]|uniref:Serine hydrolase family protein n=1 Tax=Sinorhizobium mexicanum TaxID=375549 RepID=A0A859QRC6_9HYPH|nr:alpha/beta hydrolase [Sinorhizobium mexicanum]MBP1886104.1 putative alpha/beta hydrolase family esterase [Sinorhizobium mexicanum]QLL65280.1 serine hydrolase family protein [Sinorhizobium mexicanum]
MAKTLIVPGLFGSGEGHWQRHWLADHLGAAIVEQEDWNRPTLARWRAALEAEIARHETVDLVAHSLGSVLVAALADRALAKRVRSALLVAPCDLDETERLHPGAIDFGVMPNLVLPFPSLIVGSLNDPYMPFDRLKPLSGTWGSGLVDLGHAGHINVASGFGRWAHGYDLLKVLNGMGRLKPQAPATRKNPGSLSVVDTDTRQTLPQLPSSRPEGVKSSSPR